MRNVTPLKMGYYSLSEAEGVKLHSAFVFRAGFGDPPPA